MEWVVSSPPQSLYPRERPGTHCTGGGVGPRADLDACEISPPPTGFDRRTVQTVASLYTDCANLAHPIQWVPVLFPGAKTARTWSSPLTSVFREGYEWRELCPFSLRYFNGYVLFSYKLLEHGCWHIIIIPCGLCTFLLCCLSATTELHY